MASMPGSGTVVCVTGASGYVASWIVKLLLARGYIVKATVRDISDPRKTEHLRALDGADERLKLFKANLMDEGSFDSAVEGCDAVFHTASPVLFEVEDPQTDVLDPAVKGTLNVLRSCARNSSVKRVVVTSSVGAVVGRRCSLSPEVVVDETWFSDPEVCLENKSYYSLAKTLAEEAAWKFAAENGLDLVTIIPAMCVGPLLQPILNETSATVLNLIKKGAETFPNQTRGWIHVKDVAEAHIKAIEIPTANGRYCLSERVLHFSGVIRVLQNLYPNLSLPQKCADDKPYQPLYQISKEKAKSLVMDFIPLEVSLKETVDSLTEKGFV